MRYCPGVEPEFKKCPQCKRENYLASWENNRGKCPNCDDLFSKESDAALPSERQSAPMQLSSSGQSFCIHGCGRRVPFQGLQCGNCPQSSRKALSSQIGVHQHAQVVGGPICYFCHKTQAEVNWLIVTPNDFKERAYICDQCVEVCTKLLDDKRAETNAGGSAGTEPLIKFGEPERSTFPEVNPSEAGDGLSLPERDNQDAVLTRQERELASTPEGQLLSAVTAELTGGNESLFCTTCRLLDGLTIMKVSQESMRRYAAARVAEKEAEIAKLKVLIQSAPSIQNCGRNKERWMKEHYAWEIEAAKALGADAGKKEK
jgi:hypothetical protein